MQNTFSTEELLESITPLNGVKFLRSVNEDGTPELTVERKLHDDLIFCYDGVETTFKSAATTGGNVHINGTSLEFTAPCELKDTEHFKNVTKLHFLNSSFDKYSAEYENICDIPLQLYKYTTDEHILTFFEKNSLVETRPC